MLRAWCDFHNFVSRAGESYKVLFQRFDLQFASANKLAKMNFSYGFQAWMLLSVLRLTPKTWSELLKDLGHRMPANKEEFTRMLRALQVATPRLLSIFVTGCEI